MSDDDEGKERKKERNRSRTHEHHQRVDRASGFIDINQINFFCFAKPSFGKKKKNREKMSNNKGEKKAYQPMQFQLAARKALAERALRRIKTSAAFIFAFVAKKKEKKKEKVSGLAKNFPFFFASLFLLPPNPSSLPNGKLRVGTQLPFARNH